MVNLARHRLSVMDQAEIYWWRLVVWATRLLVQIRQDPLGQLTAALRPIVGYLWVPILTGLCGAMLGLIVVIR